MKAKILYIATLVLGFVLGFFIKGVLPQHGSDIDQKWHDQFGEDMNHQRVMDFQDALKTLKAKGAKDPDELSKQLEAQLRIEDLIIKSREAQYAKFTPFSPLFAGSLSVGGILGFLAGIFRRKGKASAETLK